MKKHPIIPCLLICLAFLLMGCNSTDYQKAVGLQEAGEYAQAASIFESLGDYEDSADRVLECKYSIAESYVDSGKYEEAIQAFSEIIEYSNSADRVLECKYCLATNAFEEEKWEETLEYLDGLENYAADGISPSEMRAFSEANLAFSKGDYKDVLMLLEGLDAFSGESIYLDSAYYIFVEQIQNARKEHSADDAVAAISEYLGRSNNEEAVKDTLVEVFSEEINSRDYSSFVFMKGILDQTTDYGFSKELCDIFDEAYKQRVTAFLLGEWVREDDTPMNGAVLTVIGNEDILCGVLTDLSNTTEKGFKVGDLKWSNIEIYDSEYLTLDDISTTGNSRSATVIINYEENTILLHHISSGFNGSYGLDQLWRKK